MLRPEEKKKLIEKQKADKANKDAGEKAGGTANPKKSLSNNDDDNSSVKSTKSMADLEKDNARLKRQLKSTKAALVTTIPEGDESDLSDDEGSCGFNAALVLVSERYPSLHNGIMMAHTTKALDLRKVVLIDSQTMHDHQKPAYCWS